MASWTNQRQFLEDIIYTILVSRCVCRAGSAEMAEFFQNDSFAKVFAEHARLRWPMSWLSVLASRGCSCHAGVLGWQDRGSGQEKACRPVPMRTSNAVPNQIKSLSLSCFFFLSSFLFFAFFWFLVFVSLFSFLASLLLSHERNNIKILNYKVCFINPFSLFLGVSCRVFSFKSLFLIFVFS